MVNLPISLILLFLLVNGIKFVPHVIAQNSLSLSKTVIMVEKQTCQFSSLDHSLLMVFETSNYCVEIHESTNQTFLSLYDKKAMTWLVQKVELESVRDNWGIGYWYRDSLRTFRIYQRNDGYRWLTIQYLGQQGEEIWENELPPK